MAKKNNTLNFKNCSFRVTEDETTGAKNIYIIEETKEDTNYFNIDDIIKEFEGEEGLSISIKVEKGFGE